MIYENRQLTKKQFLFLILVFWSAYSFYFVTSAGINTSNDGGHFALAKSIYLDKDLSVEEYLTTYIRRPDYAVKDSVIYSDRLPGTALLTIPFLAYTDLALKINLIKPLQVVIGITNPKANPDTHVLGAVLLSNICGALAVLLFFYICYNILLFPFSSSIISTILFAFTTLVQLESTHLFSHAPSMMLILSAVVICLNGGMSRLRKAIICAGIVGFSTLIELQNILYGGLLFLYLLPKEYSFKKQWNMNNFKLLITGAIIIALFLILLLVYNYLAFGELMIKSNKYNPFFPEELSFITSLSGNIFEGLDRLFTSFHNIEGYFNWNRAVRNNTPGLFIANPISFFSLWGMFVFYKTYRKEFFLFISIIGISVIIPAMHVTTLTRHMFTSHALVILPLVFVINWVSIQQRKKAIFFSILIAVFAVLSFMREMHISSHYWGKSGYGLFPYASLYNYFILLNIPIILLSCAIIYYRFKNKYQTELA